MGLNTPTILKDLQFRARSLRHMPGSAAISVIVLAIGIGLCTFMFSIIYGIYFRGMDIPGAERVFIVYDTNFEQDQAQFNVPVQDLADWRERQTSFEGLLGYTGERTATNRAVTAGSRASACWVWALRRLRPVMVRRFRTSSRGPAQMLRPLASRVYASLAVVPS